MMDERDVLTTQVQLLLQQLKWAEQMLQGLPLKEPLRKAVASSFASRFTHARGALEQMQVALNKSPNVATYWGTLQRRDAECRALFNECLSFIGGVLIREHKLKDGSFLDGGICQIADALLHELMDKAPELYPGFTLLAESNFFTETTGIVRLRFPEYSVWNLPVAVHELGHFAMPDLKDGMGGRPFQAKHQQLAAEPQQAAHLKEYLADLFAVYTLGPAYLCACLVWRFNPKDGTAREDGTEHPSHAKRLHFMLRTLELMNPVSDYDYTGLVKILRELWQRSWQTAELATELEPKTLGALQVMHKEVYQILDEQLSSARYARWPQARKLAAEIASGAKSAAQLLTDESRLADVVNAAWLWRVRQQGTDGEQLRQVGERALDLCRLLAQQKH